MDINEDEILAKLKKIFIDYQDDREVMHIKYDEAIADLLPPKIRLAYKHISDDYFWYA